MNKTDITASGKAGPDAEALPQWDLSDLFPGPDSFELAQCLESIERLASAFVERYSGRIAGLGAVELLECVRNLEQIQTLPHGFTPLHS